MPNDEPVLWEARNIGEHAYCPRLFYFMQVEGVFTPSYDTEEGANVHRRVDRPSKSRKKRRDDEPDDSSDATEPDRPQSVRSLHLSSESLKLTARLDLAETREAGGRRTAVPVEYRKGRPRRVSFSADETPDEEEPGQAPLHRVEPWPTDRVQVGLQAVLLEEYGYVVPSAVLYYAAERRRVEIAVDDKLRNEAIAELEAAKRTAAGPRPLPLINDPKCPRCSLQPICLPDEVNHQRVALTVEGKATADVQGQAETLAPRRMWPPRDDGLHVVAQREGVRVGITGQALKFSDRDGKVIRTMPIAGVESLAVVGHVQVSTQALHILADRGIPVIYMTSAGRTVTVLDPLGPTSAAVRQAQALKFAVPAMCLDLAKALTTAKITNQRTLLMRNATDLPRSVAESMSELAEASGDCASVGELLGYEGAAARHYFQWFPTMIRDETLRNRFQAAGRKRRPPPDPVNAVLSFGYAMLVHECASALRLAHLDPAIGAFHRPRPRKPALALDLMEPFRPLIADSVAVALFNRGELRDGHLIDTAAGCALTDHGRRAFFDAWGRRMATVVSHPVFDYRLEYRRMLTLHARLIAAWVLGEAPTLAFLTTR